MSIQKGIECAAFSHGSECGRKLPKSRLWTSSETSVPKVQDMPHSATREAGIASDDNHFSLQDFYVTRRQNGRVVKNTHSRLPLFESWLCHLFALCLSFHSIKWRKSILYSCLNTKCILCVKCS